MEPISIAMGLAELVPSIIGWFSGDDAEDTAEQVVGIAKQVTGLEDPDDALAAIKSDPAMQLEFQKAIMQMATARYEAEAKQIDAINATIRSEITSNSIFKSGWRPAFGWVVTFTWAVQMCAVSYLIVFEAKEASKVITAMAALGFMWSLALAVLGININKRSHDKQVAAGQSPTSLFGTLLNKIKG